jgi:hypothetical protein
LSSPCRVEHTHTHNNWNSITKTVVETRTPRTKLERRANPYSSQSSSSSYSSSEPAKNLSVHLVLAMHRPPYDAFTLWNLMQLGIRRRTYFWLWFPMRVINIFNSVSLSNFNPSYSHTLSHPHTHLITTPHLISPSHRHGQLPLVHVSTALAETPSLSLPLVYMHLTQAVDASPPNSSSASPRWSSCRRRAPPFSGSGGLLRMLRGPMGPRP